MSSEEVVRWTRSSGVAVAHMRGELDLSTAGEAFACDTPVVASAVGGLLETVQDGVTGWTAPPGDVARLASAIRDVLDHPGEASRRAAAGRELVRRRFESNAAFDALAAVLAIRPS